MEELSVVLSRFWQMLTFSMLRCGMGRRVLEITSGFNLHADVPDHLKDLSAMLLNLTSPRLGHTQPIGCIFRS